MKIAVWHNLPSGGGMRALYNHVQGLLERGHAVEAWCPPTADKWHCPLKQLVQEHRIPLDWSPNGKSRFYLTRGYGAIIDSLRAMDRHCQQCAEEINRGDFDLLLANACMFFHVTSIARHVRLPAVIYLQEPCRWLYESLPRLPWVALDAPEGWWRSPRYLKRWIDNLLRVQGLRTQVREELASAKAFVSILVNSHFSRESILRAYGLDAKVCYLGVNTKLFANQKKPREDFVVGVGAVVPTKNIDFIIRALAYVRRPRPRLIWIGNVALDSYLEGLMKLANSKDVNFDAKLKMEDSELVGILNRAKLMVYAPRLEPLGLAPLEANACGLPVVAVAEGGVRETVIHGVNGLLVEHDPQKMAASIECLLDHPEYAAQLAEQGSKLVREQWTAKHSVDRLESRLLEALQAAATGR